MKYLLSAVRIAGIVMVVHGLMLIGADEISTIEAGGVRMIRSLDYILTLYQLDPKLWAATLSPSVRGGVFWVLALPGWGVFAGLGLVLSYAGRSREG